MLRILKKVFTSAKDIHDTEIRITQEKPDFKSLKKKNVMMIDMHVHTRFSDSYSRVGKILSKAEKLGIGVAITDHNEIQGVLRASEIKSAVPVIPGIEVGTLEGPHVLVYFTEIFDIIDFYERYIAPFKNADPFTNTSVSIKDLVVSASRYDSLVSVAHPFSHAYTNVPRSIMNGITDPSFFDYVDAVEVLNGAISKNRNKNAAEFAKALHMRYTGGSDSHSLFEIGSIVTCAKAGSISEFLASIKNGRNSVIGKPVGRVKRVPSLAKLSHKHMQYLVPAMCRQMEAYLCGEMDYEETIIAHKIDMIKTEGHHFFTQKIHMPQGWRRENKKSAFKYF
ncbi:MAG: PHP domain-containing protein [Proteobacteria bacterium]|nr:PHP domain-containing protein [Pseudomonadota bacterium]